MGQSESTPEDKSVSVSHSRFPNKSPEPAPTHPITHVVNPVTDRKVRADSSVGKVVLMLTDRATYDEQFGSETFITKSQRRKLDRMLKNKGYYLGPVKNRTLGMALELGLYRLNAEHVRDYHFHSYTRRAPRGLSNKMVQRIADDVDISLAGIF